jgi:hypothetical protein
MFLFPNPHPAGSTPALPNHSFEVPPGKVIPEAIAALSPMLATGGAVIPFFAPWRTVIALGDGAATFDIRRNKMDLVVFNAVAWTEDGAAEIWEGIEKMHLDTADLLARVGLLSPRMASCPGMPETLPWLATLILPAAALAANPQDLSWMADFEQCLAMTIISNLSK